MLFLECLIILYNPGSPEIAKIPFNSIILYLTSMFFQLTDNQYLIFSTIKAFTKPISNILKTFIVYLVYLGVNNAERLAYY